MMNDIKHNNSVLGYENDAFSEILHSLKGSVDIYHNAKVCGDWRINEHKLGATCFHIVTQGSCRLSVPSLSEMTLQCGDLILFPREIAHSMLPVSPLVGEQQHRSFQDSHDVEGTGLLCGEIRFQHGGFRYLLDELPPFLLIKYDEAGLWLQALLTMIIAENKDIGIASKVIFNKLGDLLFTYALRQYLVSNPNEVGMLSIYSHPRLARTVNAIHQHPERSWTLELMAKEAMLSRTSFAETFKSISGWTPGQYLTWWRMQRAWSLLKQGERIANVSNTIGYRSESSFSRAFTKMFGISAGKVKNL